MGHLIPVYASLAYPEALCSDAPLGIVFLFTILCEEVKEKMRGEIVHTTIIIISFFLNRKKTFVDDDRALIMLIGLKSKNRIFILK